MIHPEGGGKRIAGGNVDKRLLLKKEKSGIPLRIREIPDLDIE